MIRSWLVWKMAWMNLRSQWKQTLLAIVGGSVGALLITIATVLYVSVDRSGDRWLETRFGPIEWQLTPNDAGAMFTAEQTKQVLDGFAQRSDGIRGLPVVQSEATVLSLDAAGQAEHALTGALAIGLPWEQAAALNPGHGNLWTMQLGDDELVLDAASARMLDVRIGDAVALDNGTGERKQFRVAHVAEEQGLTGYRGSTGSYAGTILMTESALRHWNGGLKGWADGAYEAILVGRPGAGTEPMPFIYYEADRIYSVSSIKYDALNKANLMGPLTIFMAISGIAVLSGAVLMHQIMLMLGESRRELFGVLRAIGLSRRQVSALFIVEAWLLSLLSTAAGMALGVLAGSGLVYVFYGVFSETLARISGANIPITVSISAVNLLAVFACILLFLFALAAFVSRKLARTPIVEALRGGQPDRMSSSKGRKRIGRLAALAAAAVVAVHLILTFGEMPKKVETADVLLTLAAWLGACIAGLYLMLRVLSRSDGWLSALFGRLGLSEASIQLAVRYPKRKPGRTYAISLLFALLMMAASFTTIIYDTVLRFNDVDSNDQTMYGFGAAIPYTSPQVRDRILSLAETDAEIASAVQGMASVEPYIALMNVRGMGQSLLAATSELLEGGGLGLIERASQFADDRQAWDAVMADPKYIVLPERTERNSNIIPVYTVGETIKLSLYESKPRANDEVWVPVGEREFVVAGSLKRESDAGNAMNLYNSTFVHPDVHAEWSAYGSHWPGQSELGYVLFKLDYMDIELASKLGERFAISGLSGLQVPYAIHAAEQFMNKQLVRSFVAFSLVSAVIGLCGLAIVQFRSVRERGKQLAMLRCAGLSGRHLSQMFLLEGTSVSWVGLFTGWIIGATGAIGFVRLLLSSDPPANASFQIQYPYEMLVPIIVVLLLSALVLNLGPARAALRLSPGAAIRAADE